HLVPFDDPAAQPAGRCVGVGRDQAQLLLDQGTPVVGSTALAGWVLVRAAPLHPVSQGERIGTVRQVRRPCRWCLPEQWVPVRTGPRPGRELGRRAGSAEHPWIPGGERRRAACLARIRADILWWAQSSPRDGALRTRIPARRVVRASGGSVPAPFPARRTGETLVTTRHSDQPAASAAAHDGLLAPALADHPPRSGGGDRTEPV